MKRLFLASLALVILIPLTGCPKSPTGGGGDPGKADSFTLDKVLLPTTVNQGGSDEVTIKLNRGKDFKQDVKLSADKPPDNVKVEFMPATIKASEEPKSIMKINADKNAALGEHTIVVKATPESGTSTSIDVKIKVEKP